MDGKGTREPHTTPSPIAPSRPWSQEREDDLVSDRVRIS